MSYAMAPVNGCHEISPGVWAVNNLKKHIWRPQCILAVFITNREITLRSTLAKVFPDLQANLCMWHLNKNITTHCKKYFSHNHATNLSSDKHQSTPWNKFMSLWGQVTRAKTPNQYSEQ
jgi:hypothetical protein